MGVLEKALGIVGLQVKSDSVKWTDERGHASQSGAAGEVVSAQSSLSLSAVWACGNLISGSVSSLPFEVHKKTAGGFAEVLKDHPLQKVIYDSPNFDQTPLDFWDFISLSVELWGNAYARVARDGEKIVALYPIAPEAMTVRRLETGSLEYRWTEDGGKAFTRLDRDVLHIRGPGGNPLGGMSTLRFGREAFSSALAADRTAAGMFKNGLRPSGVLKFAEWLTPEQRKVATEALAERYIGAVNAGRPFIAEGGVDYQNITISPEDAQMLETRQFSIEEICRFFQVPPALIGHAGASTAWPTSVEQQIIMFQTFYLRRRLKRIEQAVSKQLLTPQERAQGISTRFNMDGLLRGDTASRFAAYQTGLQNGIYTINEVRRKENMEDIEGGNIPRLQMQNVPITEAGNDPEK